MLGTYMLMHKFGEHNKLGSFKKTKCYACNIAILTMHLYFVNGTIYIVTAKETLNEWIACDMYLCLHMHDTMKTAHRRF